MTPFAIAGIQMPISAESENITAMGKRLAHLMHRFPWVQMVLFSELAAFGPAPRHAQPLPGPAEAAFCEMAARYHVWLIPGSLFYAIGFTFIVIFNILILGEMLKSKSNTYGALGIAAGLLLAFFFVGRLIVGAAVLNATLYERRTRSLEARRGAASEDRPAEEVLSP